MSSTSSGATCPLPAETGSSQAEEDEPRLLGPLVRLAGWQGMIDQITAQQRAVAQELLPQLVPSAHTALLRSIASITTPNRGWFARQHVPAVDGLVRSLQPTRQLEHLTRLPQLGEAFGLQLKVTRAWQNPPYVGLGSQLSPFPLPQSVLTHQAIASLVAPQANAISQLLSGFTGVAERVAHTANTITGWLRRSGVTAVLAARDAAINGDLDAIAAFVRDWLKLAPRPGRVRAAADVLLEEGWLDVPLDEVVAYLRRMVIRRYQSLRSIFDRGRPLRGQPVISLDTSLSHDHDDDTLLDQLKDVGIRDPIEALIDAHAVTPTLRSVLERLTLEERDLAVAHALTGASWPQIARQHGLPDHRGDALRRKLRRLGARPGMSDPRTR